MDWFATIPLCLIFAVETSNALDTSRECGSAVKCQEVFVNTEQCVHETDEEFLSVALDSGLIRHRWRRFNFSSEKIQNLARGLYPAFLRIGGTDEDFLIFTDKPRGQTEQPDVKKYTNFTMNGSDVDKIFHFANRTGLRVLFGLNVLLRTSEMNWDSSNAEKLMNYMAKRGYLCGWELGNEPVDLKGLVNRTITGKQLAKDFQILREVLDKHPEYGQLIVGPDVSSPWNGQTRPVFLEKFLSNIKTSIDAITYHQYYTDNKASVTDFYNPKVLDFLIEEIQGVKNIIKKSETELTSPWLGETSSAFDGGVPGVSDSYVAGFMWLDKLGVAARLRHNVVVRQTFYGGSYSLINEDTFDPFPDYWSSLLYKRLVGTQVLEVKDGIAFDRRIRVYAHCTSNRSIYAKGSVVLFALNTQPYDAKLILMNELRELIVEQYLLTPGVAGNLTSQTVLLNGQHLKLLNDKYLPSIQPKRISPPQDILLASLSYGFFVIPQANAKACQVRCSHQLGTQYTKF